MANLALDCPLKKGILFGRCGLRMSKPQQVAMRPVSLRGLFHHLLREIFDRSCEIPVRDGGAQSSSPSAKVLYERCEFAQVRSRSGYQRQGRERGADRCRI